ncbi:MAG: hypothetical protein M1825_001359 [Sarcosagium campestre]|nr:MAG: hypothetical protein M1825_001359 [Sarcosagium campestre]
MTTSPKRRTALVLYGSETGNAQDVAEEVARMTESLHFTTRMVELNDVDIDDLKDYSIVIISISTTGQGDLPANAQSFWKSVLRRKLRANTFSNVPFTSFGLGDSSYPKTDGAFLPWLIDLRRQLANLFPLPPGLSPVPDSAFLQPKWRLELARDSIGDLSRVDKDRPIILERHSSLVTKGETSGQTKLRQSEVKNSIEAKLLENTRVTPDGHWQDVRRVGFTIDDHIEYRPGDTLTLYPQNFPDDVDALIELMGWQEIADEKLQFQPTQEISGDDYYPDPPISNPPASSSLTVRNLLIHHLDITAIPRRAFFSLIVHFTNNEMHKDRLLEFTNPEFIDELYDYTTRPRRSIVEVLQEFDSVKIPWQWVASVLPPLRGRQFSIASGGALKHHPTLTSSSSTISSTSTTTTRIELLVAIVKYRTVIKKIRQGVCTRYIAALNPGMTIRVVLQRGGLNVSAAEDQRPVVMIGPGTGIAPMRSMIWERAMRRESGFISGTDFSSLPPAVVNGGASIATDVLFFGCRNREADYFFRDEWEQFEKSGSLKVFTAFSRDQREKVYVQDVIRKQAQLVYKLLHEQQGTVYICGSSGKMPQAVREALVEVFQSQDDRGREAAEAYLIGMEKEGRYKQETW